MQLLVVGASGLLGGNVVTEGLDRDWSVAGTYCSNSPQFDCPLHRLDITSPDAVKTLIEKVAPDAVVNCAAMTDVDGCEANPERAHAVNADGAGHLAAASSNQNAAFIHTSTDYIFDGEREIPYPETADPQPIQEYGESKIEGERCVHAAHDTPIIARLSFVYGRTKPDETLSGFPAWVRETAAANDSIPLFTDQYITPSYAKSTAEALLDLLEAGETGIFNVSSRSCITPYEFGTALLKEVDRSTELVTDNSMADIDRAAMRPVYTCLDSSKIENTLDRPQPTLREDLAELF